MGKSSCFSSHYIYSICTDWHEASKDSVHHAESMECERSSYTIRKAQVVQKRVISAIVCLCDHGKAVTKDVGRSSFLNCMKHGFNIVYCIM